MKKNKLPFIVLLATALAISACSMDTTSFSGRRRSSSGVGTSSSINNGDYDGESGQSSGGNPNSSQGSGQSSGGPITPDVSSLDGDIAKFLNGINVTVPALNGYDLEYSVIYYYAYQQYMIVAGCETDNDDFASNYASKFTSDSNLTSLNDEYWYTIEDYGYLFGDNDEKVSINFFLDDGYFSFSIARSDGEAGTLDISGVDTSWYVDYVNFQGMEVLNNFPALICKQLLDITSIKDIPCVNVDEYVVGFQKAYFNEYGYYVPDTFYVVLEGDKINNFDAVLKEAGFPSVVTENISEDFDWDLLDYVEVTYYTGEVKDIADDIFITYALDDYGNTMIAINKLTDAFTLNKTTNTDWTANQKTLMEETLHAVLPFMQFGEDYVLYDASDEDYDCLVLEDTYIYDLSEDYIAVLLANGYKEDRNTYTSTCYYRDNGLAYIEVFVDYDNGHYLEIYFEESKIPAVTTLELDKSALDIVAGGSYQLEVSCTPKEAIGTLVWSSSNEDVATVNNGLVTINNNATVGATAAITVTALNGKTASCVFTVTEDVVSAIAFTQSNYKVVPGGEPIKTEFIASPVGATVSGAVTYGSSTPGEDYAAGLRYDESGNLSVTSECAVGTTFTIYAEVNGSLRANATVTVVSAEVTHTINQAFFDLVAGNSTYATHNKTTDDGASYEAQCCSGTGVQIRSKNNNSGVIGQFEGRTCKSITFTFDASTLVPDKDRGVEIYASNSPFSIADMYGTSVTKVGTITFDKNNLTQTYTFTSDYSYIGFRSMDGAVYLNSIEIVWQ